MSLQSNPDPGRTLGQFGLAVLALVVFAAGAFWLIDLVSDEPETVAAPGVAEPSAAPSPSAVAAPTPSPTPTATATPEPSPTATSAEPTPSETTAEPTEAETTEDEPTEDESDEPTEDPTSEEPSDEATDDGDDDADLSETSVQVLDGIKDGSDRAQDIADDLEDDGYRVVAFGPSSVQYENTTVFWTEGHEDEAERLADDNGWDEIVFNEILSETVDVHVVVGLDEQD